MKIKSLAVILTSIIAVNSYSFFNFGLKSKPTKPNINTSSGSKKSVKGDNYQNIVNKVLKSRYETSETVSVDTDKGTAVSKSDMSSFSGTYVDFYNGKNVRSIKNFKNGKYHGNMYFFYENGAIMKTLEFSNGKKTGEEIEFHSNGNSKSIKNFKNGVSNGSSYEYDASGRLIKQATYKNGVLDGLSKMYYPDGKLKAYGNYSNDFREGEWVWKYPDGSTKIVEQYKKGQLEGKVVGYFPDGSMERVMNLANGNGNFVQYYSNGKIKAKGNYKNYKEYGDWSFFDKNGNLISQTKLN